MPQAIPFVVSAVTTAFTTAVHALTVPLVSAGLTKGVASGIAAFAVKTAAFTALSAATAAIAQPRTGAAGNPLDFRADPAAPIRGLMGRCGTGGNKIYGEVWGKKNLYLSMMATLSLGPCEEIEAFYANGALVTFPGTSGAVTSGFYTDCMWQEQKLGLPSDGALGPPTGVFNGSPALTGWGASYKTTGHAAAFWTLSQAEDVEKRTKYTTGVPDPLWVGKWMWVYDPREDGEHPGGEGDQRADEWATWTWTANPFLHALAWVRGHFRLNADGTIDKAKRIAGIGAPDETIDYAAFIEGANIAEANGWTICGEWSTSDSKWQVLKAMLQAGGAIPLNLGAKISCLVSTPRTSIYTYTRDDLIGPASIKAQTPRRERKNTLIPRYRSEENDWEFVPAGAVTSSVYREEDRGEPRTLEVEYSFVGGPDAEAAEQVAQLAAYDVANAREGLRSILPSRPHLLGLRAGDAFTADLPEMGLEEQKFIVLRRGFDPQSATVTLEVRSETDGKHAWALGQTANPPPTPSLTANDPLVIAAPDEGSFAATGGTVGVTSTIPAIIVTGVVDDGHADRIVLWVRKTGDTDWMPVAEGPVTATRFEITGLEPETSYEPAISYRSIFGADGERLVLDPVDTGTYVSQQVVDQGDLATLNEVDTPQLVTGAVNQFTSTYTEGNETISAGLGWVTVATVVVTTITDETVDLDGEFNFSLDTALTSTMSIAAAWFKDGVQMAAQSNVGSIEIGAGDHVIPNGRNGSKINDTPGAGTFTYTLRAQASGSEYVGVAARRYGRALTLKKPG